MKKKLTFLLAFALISCASIDSKVAQLSTSELELRRQQIQYRLAATAGQWRPRENRRAHGSSVHRTDATRSRPGQPRCHRRAQPFARRKRGNRAGAASAPPNGAAMISQYLGLAFKDVPKHDKAHPSPSTHATPSDTFFDLYKKNIFSPSPSP